MKASIRYMTFHRAIEQFYQRHYGHDIPQKRYGEIKDITLTSPQRGNSYIKAKRIIDRWTDYFIKKAGSWEIQLSVFTFCKYLL